MVDSASGFVSGNPAAIRLFGCASEEEFVALSPESTSPEYQPDGSLSREVVPRMTGLALEHGSHAFEWVHRRVNGETFWAEVVLTRFEWEGRLLVQASVRDIQERKEAEQKIRELNRRLASLAEERTQKFDEAHQRLRQLIDGASDAVVTIDQSGTLVDWNSAAERTFGWTRDEALGKRMQDLIIPEALRAGHAAGMQRFVETGQSRVANRRIEIRALHRDGHEFDVELSIWPVKTASGYTFSAFLRDISERKKSEAALEKRTERLRRQRDVLMDLAQLDKTDFERALTAILRAAATTLKVERVSFWSFSEDYRSLECRQLFLRSRDAVNPAAGGTRLLATDYGEYFRAIREEQTLIAPDAIVHPATAAFRTTYLEPEGIGAMVDATVWFRGRPIGVVCHEHVGPAREWLVEDADFATSIATMVSLSLESFERIQAENRFRTLQRELASTLAEREAVLENSSAGIGFVRDGRFLWTNQTLSDLTGYDRNDLIGKSPELIFPADETEAPVAEASLSLSMGEGFHCERPLRKKSGEPLWSRLAARNVHSVDPSQGSIWTVQDISERVRAEEEIRRALEKARELNELKTRFVAMTSHEFRTPLSTILSSIELIQHYGDKISAEERADLFKSVAAAVERMTGMLNDVLVLGRAESGEFNPDLRPVDLQAFCKQIVGELSLTLPQNVRIDFRPPESGLFEGDEKLFRHIFVNLLSNAIKYSPEGGTVEFSVETTGKWLRFTVRDEGIGIPEEDLPRLFESFHRATNVGNIAGTGLGLSIVKKTVERLGGDITVDTKVGQGTKFLVTLPARKIDG